MPRYITSNKLNKGVCCEDNSIDRNSSIFFYNLSNKLLDLSKSIETKMENLKNQCNNNTKHKGLCVLAQITTPSMNIGIKMEYAIYMQQYGPPKNGKWDQNILHLIRCEHNLL
jgi:hypothetical protein